MEGILLVGAGGHARACIDVIELDGRFTIVGLLGTATEVGTSVLGYKVLGTDDELPHLRKEVSHALVTVGQIKTPDARIRLYQALETGRWLLPAIVSPRGYVSRHATVGAGSIVMHGAVVNAAASVGRNCIINNNALVEHDCTVEDHCHVATNAAVNSGVRIGMGSFIGSGSSVRQGVRIGERVVVGMGQRILSDCAPGTQVPPRSVA